MTENKEHKDLQPVPDVDEERRSFLKTSVYAAYATPLITALLVAEKAAAASGRECRRACREQYPPGPERRACRADCPRGP